LLLVKPSATALQNVTSERGFAHAKRNNNNFSPLKTYQNLFMENLHQLLIERHSIRRYTDRKVSAEDVKTILQAALLAPTSKSARPWQFVVVEDKEKLNTLAGCKPIAAHAIRGAAFAVVVMADPGKSDMFIEDCAIAAQFMQLQAADLGIGSCWIQVRNRFNADGEPSETLVQQTLGIPEYLKVECIMSFGYPDENRRPVDESKLKWEKVHIEQWSEQDPTQA
jgi:nitroreductase